MKFNLKNRPKNAKHLPSCYLDSDKLAYEEWFEAFEKECRQRIKELEKCIRKNKGDSFNNMRLTLIAQIKEVLGETTK
jgi:hypothetical protein